MKKPIAVITAAVCITCVAASLSGCGSPNVKFVGASEIKDRISNTLKTDESERSSRDNTTDDEFNRYDEKYERPVIIGVRRRFTPRHVGTYGVDYVRFPQNSEKDETLDYKLTLKSDDTFELTVVSDGITAEHYGHYYIRYGGSITLFYDEEREPTAHNVYVSDSLYGEFLPNGKIIFYDNCNTIILAHENSAETNSDADYFDETFGGFGYCDGFYGTQYGGIALYAR